MLIEVFDLFSLCIANEKMIVCLHMKDCPLLQVCSIRFLYLVDFIPPFCIDAWNPFIALITFKSFSNLVIEYVPSLLVFPLYFSRKNEQEPC